LCEVKLVFIYGPPAVGKLTVATELARLTGFRLFDNHVSIDFVKSVFDFGTRRYWRLIDKFRISMFREVAKNGVNTIFTFAYDKAIDDHFVKKTIQTISNEGGRVCFVRLFCDEEELARRVNSKSRRELGKVSTKKLLAKVLKRHGLADEVPFQTSLSIDTTHLPAKKSARMIARHYKLLRYTRGAPADIVPGSFS
jgi:chloramphenicol phosphotransferase-like protein